MSEAKLRELYEKARLRGAVPEGGWPETFGVVTAWNPMGEEIPKEENAERSERLRMDLVSRGLRHFPLTGFDTGSDYHEEGFGIVCDLEETIRLGRDWDQLAVFWVEKGWVSLVYCEEGGVVVGLRSWGEMVPF